MSFNPIQQIKQFLYPYEKAFRQRRPPEKNWELKSQTLTENRKRKSDYPAPEQLVGCSAALGAVAGGSTWHTSRWDTVMSFSAAIEAKKKKKKLLLSMRKCYLVLVKRQQLKALRSAPASRSSKATGWPGHPLVLKMILMEGFWDGSARVQTWWLGRLIWITFDDNVSELK